MGRITIIALMLFLFIVSTSTVSVSAVEQDWSNVDWEHFDWGLLDNGENWHLLSVWLMNEADIETILIVRENCAHAAFLDAIARIMSDRFCEEPQAMLLAIADEDESHWEDLVSEIVLGADAPNEFREFLENLHILGSNARKQNRVLQVLIDVTESIFNADIFNSTASADHDMLTNIAVAWLSANGYDLKWDGEALYYGIIGNCGVFLLNGPIADETVMEVAGFSFWHSGSFQIYAYDGEKFFTLQEAYQSGLLSATEIETIHNVHSQYGIKNPDTGEVYGTLVAASTSMLLSAAAIGYLKKKETM